VINVTVRAVFACPTAALSALGSGEGEEGEHAATVSHTEN